MRKLIIIAVMLAATHAHAVDYHATPDGADGYNITPEPQTVEGATYALCLQLASDIQFGKNYQAVSIKHAERDIGPSFNYARDCKEAEKDYLKIAAKVKRDMEEMEAAKEADREGLPVVPYNGLLVRRSEHCLTDLSLACIK